MTTEPRLATTICVLGPDTAGAPVLMVRRAATMRFMPGAWVFPGGAIDPADDGAAARAAVVGSDPSHAPWAAAGIREVFEETGIWLSSPPMTVGATGRPSGAAVYDLATRLGTVDGAAIHHLCTWITPTMVPVRFHTRFSVVAVDDLVDGDPDGTEIDEVSWIRPEEAAARAAAGDMALPLPTRHTLAGFAAAGARAAILDRVRSAPSVPVIQPRLRLDGDVIIALIPGDDEYDDTPDLPPDPATLARAVAVRSADGGLVPEMTPP
ncbi:MAG: NUDIX hydrolase [Acidimicrobiia bacterium]|nr:NUDIX hydrolase [Acidimicrobiia bacterium]